MTTRVSWPAAIVGTILGAIVGAAALFFYGLIRFENGWYSLTLQQFAIGLVLVGGTAGALLGLVLGLTRQRGRFLVLVALFGAVVGVVFGFSFEETCILDDTARGPCGIAMFGRILPRLVTVALLALIGACLGALAGLGAAGASSSSPASERSVL
jgi:hypothetical protein